ncbi:retrovirus-related Pol polyprotein from transposon 17.6 [Trichonephila clavipes]|nr:retrovirus-related Pol polyprotein from transposon 17.6 [Trichonephila clavipes]
MNVPENELVYIDSVNENETKCAMKNSTYSNFKNVEMVSETTWYKNVSLDVNNKCFDVNFKLDIGAEVNILPLYILISAPEVFQKRNQKLSGDIEGVEIYFDDIIVAGCDEDSHDAIMSRVLERAKLLNIKFNPDKLHYKVSEVKYVAPLGEIIHENVEFNWGKEQELSFVHIKELLAKAPILKVFSVNNEIVIQCGSSKDGLGSCLIPKDQPVSFVSRSEKNYAQIEKELLAIVFSFEQYHNFVYGHKVVVQSDHPPLMAIVKKPMHKISSRMQRMILKLLKYDFEINYVPGNQMFLADAVSRASLVSETVRDDPEMLNIVHTISKHLSMREKRRVQFKKETELDPELQIVVKHIKGGWPNLTKM